MLDSFCAGQPVVLITLLKVVIITAGAGLEKILTSPSNQLVEQIFSKAPLQLLI